MKKDLPKKIAVWTIIILMCLALTIPYITGLISKFFVSDPSQNVTIETQDISTPEAVRKMQEEAQKEYEASSTEAERKAAEEIVPLDGSVFTGKNLKEVNAEATPEQTPETTPENTPETPAE
jgi:hypothetical protein